MIEINELVFDNDDIGRLAIHLGNLWRPKAGKPLPVAVIAGNATAYTGYGLLLGYSLQDTGGAAANVMVVHDSTDANGPSLVAESVPSSGVITKWFGLPGLHVERGLTVVGQATGSAVFYVLVGHRHD